MKRKTITGLLIVATVSLSGCEAMMQDLKGEDPNVIAERQCNSILEQSRLECIQDAVDDARPIRSDAEYNKQQDKGAIIIGVLHIHADNVSGVKQRGLMAGDRLYTIR